MSKPITIFLIASMSLRRTLAGGRARPLTLAAHESTPRSASRERPFSTSQRGVSGSHLRRRKTLRHVVAVAWLEESTVAPKEIVL